MRSVLPFIAVLIVLAAAMVSPAAAAIYYSSSVPQIITKGDAFTVSGTGAANGTVALWIIGRNHFEVRTVAPDRHGNYSIPFKSTETEKFSSGQYAIILQDPGPSGTMEIESGHDSGGNLTIMNRGKIILRIGKPEDLRANVQSETDALTSSANLQGVDDTFVSESFFVEEPAVHFDGIIPASGSRLADKMSGDAILITGTTNIGSENPLRAILRNAGTTEPVTTKNIAVIPGITKNRWSYGIDAPGLEPGHYILTVGWTKSNTTGSGSAQFDVKDAGGNPATPPAPGPLPLPADTGLPKGLDTLLIIGIIFVFAVVVYTIGKK